MTHNDIYTKFMIEYDKANVTSSYPALTKYEVATLLDRAYLTLIARKLTGNNTRRVPFEYDTKAIEDLRPLVVTSKFNSSAVTTTVSNEYTFSLPSDLMYYLEGVAEFGSEREVVTPVNHQIARKFKATNSNIPWINSPVSYIEGSSIHVFVDPFEHKIGPEFDGTYIKKPASFVTSLTISQDQNGGGNNGGGDNPPDDSGGGNNGDGNNGGGGSNEPDPNQGNGGNSGQQTPQFSNTSITMSPSNSNGTEYDVSFTGTCNISGTWKIYIRCKKTNNSQWFTFANETVVTGTSCNKTITNCIFGKDSEVDARLYFDTTQVILKTFYTQKSDTENTAPEGWSLSTYSPLSHFILSDTTTLCYASWKNNNKQYVYSDTVEISNPSKQINYEVIQGALLLVKVKDINLDTDVTIKYKKGDQYAYTISAKIFPKNLYYRDINLNFVCDTPNVRCDILVVEDRKSNSGVFFAQSSYTNSVLDTIPVVTSLYSDYAYSTVSLRDIRINGRITDEYEIYEFNGGDPKTELKFPSTNTNDINELVVKIRKKS